MSAYPLGFDPRSKILTILEREKKRLYYNHWSWLSSLCKTLSLHLMLEPEAHRQTGRTNGCELETGGQEQDRTRKHKPMEIDILFFWWRWYGSYRANGQELEKLKWASKKATIGATKWLLLISLLQTSHKDLLGLFLLHSNQNHSGGACWEVLFSLTRLSTHWATSVGDVALLRMSAV